jgi:Fe-S cluster assembly scaffold protein SufB
VAAQGVPPLAHDEGAALAERQVRPPIDYQDISYYSAPKKKKLLKSLDEVDPELLATYEKLGIPLDEQKLLAGVAVDAVFDSVSVATTFKESWPKLGIIFCSFSEAVRASRAGEEVSRHGRAAHRQLLRDAQLGGVQRRLVRLRAEGRALPDGAVDLLPHQRANTGQFERTLIIADEGAYVSYLEGCTAPMRDENQLHAAVVELVALDDATIKYSTVQNWYPGDKKARAASTTSSPSAATAAAQLEDLLDAGRDRLGDHLEVSELHPAGRQLGRRVLLGRDRRTTTSRPTPAPR